MDATQVDWSMGSQAARLADWDAALAIGRRVAGPGVSVPASERARMREDFAELTPFAEERITEFTSLDPTDSDRAPGSWRGANGSGRT